MDRRSLSVDQYGGLRPFYQLCWLGSACSLVALLFVSGNLQSKRWGPFLPFLPGVGVVTLAASAGLLFRRRALSSQNNVEGAARRSETDRLRHKLDLVRTKARQLSNTADLDVLLVPGRGVSAWVARSRHRPLIEVTSAFWSLYQGHPEFEGAMAHEVGHVVARDVEHFHGLYYLVGVVGSAWTLFVAIACAILASAGRVDVLSSLLAVVGTIAFSAVAIGGTWSALLVARELQADAFAANALGDERPIKAFLQHQQELRLKERGSTSFLKAAWRWLIQPDLQWRASFPVLHGRIGSRVELMLGVGIFGALMVPLWTVLLLAAILEDKAAGQAANQGQALVGWLVVLAVALMLLWIVYQFLWYRNWPTGRTRTLLRSLGTWGRLSLPSAALFVLLLGVLYSISRPTGFGPGERLLAVAALPVISFVLWSAAMLAAAWEGRRGATRPSMASAVAAMAVVLGAGAACTMILLMLVGRGTSSRLWVAGSFVLGFPLAALGMGLFGYRKLHEGRYTHVESG